MKRANSINQVAPLGDSSGDGETKISDDKVSDTRIAYAVTPELEALIGTPDLVEKKMKEKSEQMNYDIVADLPSGIKTTNATNRKGRNSILMKSANVSMKAPRIVYSGKHIKPIICAAVLGQERKDTLLFSGSEDKTIGVWSLKTGKLVTVLRGHDQRVSCLTTFFADGFDPVVISGSWDETVRVWPMTNCFENTHRRYHYEESCKVLLGHTNRINAIAIARPKSNDPLIVSGAADNTIHVWSIRNTEQFYCLQDVHNVTWVLSLATYYDPDTHLSYAVSGCKDTTVRVWKLPGRNNTDPECLKKPYSVIKGHTSRVHSIAFFENECPPQSFKELQDETGDFRLLRRTTVEWKARNPMLITLCRDYDIRVWSLSGVLTRTFKGHTSTITSVAVHPIVKIGLKVNAYVISSCVEGDIRLWDFKSGELLRVFNGHFMECTFVTSFEPVERPGDFVIVSASKDMTMRTWLHMEDRSLLHRTHDSRLNAIAMYCDGYENTIAFTGSDDGGLQAENIMLKDIDSLKYPAGGWRVQDAHSARVRSLAIYAPITTGSLSLNMSSEHCVADLSRPMLISGGRDNMIRATDIRNGEQIGDFMVGHDEDVTSVRVFCGSPKSVYSEEILPFVITGSEDTTVKLWSLVDFKCINTFRGHTLDVTGVDVLQYTDTSLASNGKNKGGPLSIARIGQMKSMAMNRVGALRSESFDASVQSSSNASSNASLPNVVSASPTSTIIVSGSMDHTICVWSYFPVDDDEDSASPHLLARLEDCPEHITCVRCAVVKKKPLLVAGGGDALIYVWSLEEPFELLYTLGGHVDEVQSLDIFSVEGLYPVLASGSWDHTVRLWNMNTMKYVRTIEGHRSEVTGLQMFYAGGTDAAIASVSSDKSCRIMFDFMGGIPRKDFVKELFLLDCQSANIATEAGKKPGYAGDRWPRIEAMVDEMGAEHFFMTFNFLFGLAIDTNQSDFISEYLPQCREALLKTNVPYRLTRLGLTQGNIRRASTVLKLLRGDSANLDLSKVKQGTLLKHALEYKDITAVRAIVSCWGRFLTDHTNAANRLLYDKRAELDMQEVITLQEIFPKEFENLINELQLMPLPLQYLPDHFEYMYEDRDRKLVLTSAFRSEFDSPDKDKVDIYSNESFLFLPLPCMAHMDMMTAYSNTCEELDSVAIFDSDAGQLALSFAWRAFGRKTHMISMLIYYFYVAIAATAIYSFNTLVNSGMWVVGGSLLLVQLAMDIFFIYREMRELFHAPYEYLSDMWNQLDGVVIVGGVVGNTLRLYYWKDTELSKVALSITSVCMWFNVLFYLRAFESTGPLVSMIIRICRDMQALMFVVFLVILGFSQAFWLLSNRQEEPNDDIDHQFSTIKGSLIGSFTFMLGGYDASNFTGIDLEDFAVLLSALYMLIVSILLLNLLIALMGDSYSEVREKGLAQWRFEQAQLIIENSAAMSQKDRENKSTIFFRKKKDDVDADIIRNQFNIEIAVTQLERKIASMHDTQASLLEAVQELMEKVPSSSNKV